MSRSNRTADQSEVRQEQKVLPSQHEEDQTVLLPFPFLGPARGKTPREWTYTSRRSESRQQVHHLPLSVGMGQGTRNQRPYATKAAMRNRSTVRHSHPVPPQVRHCGTAEERRPSVRSSERIATVRRRS